METIFWGPSGWEFLHILTFIYPENPSLQDKILFRDFMHLVSDILPCKYCRASFTKYSQSLDITPFLDTRHTMINWLYKMHNKVNKKLRSQGYCHYENPTLSHVETLYSKHIKQINTILEKHSAENKFQTIVNYICNLGCDFLGSIIFNYQGYFVNCHTSEEKTKIISTYHKFFNIIIPVIAMCLRKYNDEGEEIVKNYNIDNIKKFRIRNMLLQNEPYSKLKKWFFENNKLCDFQKKNINTIEKYEEHFGKHIVATCNSPINLNIKSCRINHKRGSTLKRTMKQ